MIQLTQKLDGSAEPQAILTLPFASRIKSRLRTSLDDGREVGLFLNRAQVLQEGDLLSNDDGLIVKVIAAAETVSRVASDDAWLMARAVYHLGNRHTALQIEPGWIQYRHDHVLDSMLEGLGLHVTVTQAPFTPEPGAYTRHT